MKNPFPTFVPDRALKLLAAWITRRSTVDRSCHPNARGIVTWCEKKGDYVISDYGVCLERSTAPMQDDDVSETGWAFMDLPEREQRYILAYALHPRDTFKKIAAEFALGPRVYMRLLKNSFTHFVDHMTKRELMEAGYA